MNKNTTEEKYAECNFDGKPLHPVDKKTLEDFVVYRKLRTQGKTKREIKEIMKSKI